MVMLMMVTMTTTMVLVMLVMMKMMMKSPYDAISHTNMGTHLQFLWVRGVVGACAHIMSSYSDYTNNHNQ